MNPEELKSLRIAYLDPRMAARSDATSGALTLRPYKSIEEIPISEDFIDVDHYKDELGEDGVAFLVDFADKVQVAPDPYTVFAKNLPENVQELAPGVVEMFKIEAAANNAQIMNSHTYAFANTVQIWDMEGFIALIDVANEEPRLLMSASKNDVQNKQLVWAAGFGVELLLGLLSILGAPKLSHLKLAKFLKKILENPALKEMFSLLKNKLTAAAVIAFICKLYEEGLLGDLVEEAMTGASAAAIAFAILLIASKFFSGGTALAIHASVIAVELGAKVVLLKAGKS